MQRSIKFLTNGIIQLFEKFMPEQTTIGLTQTVVTPSSQEVPVKELMQYGIYTNSLRHLPIQRKLSIGAVDDPLEEEADAMADRVMRMPENTFIQKKCSHCEEEESIQRKPFAFIQKKCAHCEEEEKVQRRPFHFFIQKKGIESNNIESNNVASDIISNQIQSTRGGGSPLPERTKSFMESRFDADFSGVRIHTGHYASDVSEKLNAQAFTVGNDIYFNRGTYNPESDSGKNLIAHELTHTIQQESGGNQKMQRRVSPHIKRIRSRLTYGLFDWAVTDGDVRAVLKDLKDLSAADLRDTVANLEKDGLINRLYSNLEESDDRKIGWVEELMMKIQTVRVQHGPGNTTFVGSCNTDRINKTQGKLPVVVSWAKKCGDAILNFIYKMPGFERIRQMLEKYFFHESKAGVLTEGQQVKFAEEIKAKIKNVEDNANGTRIQCGSPFDRTCGTASAYVSGTTMIMCEKYFGFDDNKQTAVLFHELMHFYNDDVHDTGYIWERVFEYLPPGRAITNADSYSTFAADLIVGGELAAGRTVTDAIEGCDPQQEQNLRREIAFAMRMIQNAENEITHTHFSIQNSNNAATTHFKASTHDDMNRFSDKLRDLSVPSSINFHCEPNSAQLTDTLPFSSGRRDRLNITRPYFNVPAENRRISILLAILFKKYSDGMRAPVWPSQAAYATQTIDQAFQNPAAFAGYVRDISIRPRSEGRQEWNFADATIRYREQANTTFGAIRDDFREHYDEENFLHYILSKVFRLLSNPLRTTPISNHDELEAGIHTLQDKARHIRPFLDKMFHDYIGLHNDNFFAGLMAFKGTAFSESKLYTVFDGQYEDSLFSLGTSFQPILEKIGRGEAVRFEDWTDYPVLFTAFQKKSQQTLATMLTYKAYVEKLSDIKNKYHTLEQTLSGSQEMHDLPFDELVDVSTNIMSNNAAFDKSISDIEEAIIEAVRQGKGFNRRDPAFPDLDRLARRFQTQLRRVAHPARRTR